MRTTIVTTGMVGLFLIGTAACRPQTDDARRSTAEPAPAPSPAPPPATANEEPAQGTEKVGTAETHAATTTAGADAAAATGATATAAGSTATNLPPFEGELDVKVPGKGSESLEYAMKGDKIRLGLSGVPGRSEKGFDAIIDTQKQKATVLLNDKKQFVEVDLAKAAKRAQQRIESVDVQKTGKTDTVSGRTCEEWLVKDRDVRVNACVMKGAPYFDLAAIEREAGFHAPPWVHRIVDAGYVPLRVSITEPNGKTLASSQIADASRKVDESQFQVPNGYTKTDASKLTGQSQAK